jgi:hypothetical protein
MTTPNFLPATRPSTQLPSDSKPQREMQALLARTASAKKRGNIERVWAALEDMRARKEKDFSLASVSKAIERLGLPGPKYQSMRNKEGADFRALVDAYRQAHGRAPTVAGEAGDGDEDLALAIADPTLQQRVRVLVRQVRALQDRNRILHDQVVRTSSESSAPASTAPHSHPVGEAAFTEDEVEAVEGFLGRLEPLGLLPDEHTGSILDRRSNREVAPPYFLDALKRLLRTAGRRAD